MTVKLHRHLGAALGGLWLLFASACQASTPSAPEHKGVLRQPQSSFSALVRALEVVDALHDPRAYVRVRAVECDSILDRARHAEYARVLLDLTVYAHDVGTARDVFDHLALTLEEEAGEPGRFDAVPPHRAERVFQAMNWDAEGLPEDCLSYSDVLRLDVRRGRRPALPAEAVQLDDEGEAPTQPIREYVRSIAEGAVAGIGPVHTEFRMAEPSRGTRDMRVLIRPESPDASFTRDQIGRFLSELEAKSPLARITRVEIGRAAHLPEWRGDDAWTFEAILTLRVTRS